jgi:hypothetical protein
MKNRRDVPNVAANTFYFFCRVNSFFRSMFIPKAPGLIFSESTKRRHNGASGSLLTAGHPSGVA